MNDYEEELSKRLGARADGINPGGDFEQVVERLVARERRASRVLAALLVVTLCGASVAVAAAVRHDDNRGSQTATKRASGASLSVTHAKVPTIAGASLGAASAGSNGSAAPSGGSSAPLKAVTYGGVALPSGAIAFQALPSSVQPLARVFVRTTASGVTVRAYRGDLDQASTGGPPWWSPADYCYPSGLLQADVSNDVMAASTAGSLYKAFKDASVGGSVALVGTGEQSPLWVVIAQGPANTAKLRATFPDGSHDEMTPVDGVAVLIGPASSDVKDDANAHVTITALDGSGATVSSAQLSATYSAAAADPACTAPQSLPAPGAQQPADPAAARAAVIDAFNHAYGRPADFSYFDDPTGLADIGQKLVNGPFAAEAKNAQIVFDNLVFESPTRAAIQFHIHIPNYSDFTNRWGEAVLVNGAWKITRQTFCDIASLGGVPCPSA